MIMIGIKCELQEQLHRKNVSKLMSVHIAILIVLLLNSDIIYLHNSLVNNYMQYTKLIICKSYKLII